MKIKIGTFEIEVDINDHYRSVTLSHVTDGYYGCDDDVELTDKNIIELSEKLIEYCKHLEINRIK